MRRVCHATALLAALLAACSVQPPRPTVSKPQTPADFPVAYYEQAAAQGRPVFSVNPQRSLVTIEVRRAGSLARFGHDHVVASHDLQGYVASDEGRADLYVPLERLAVDEPALREEAGFSTKPSEADIAGTRGNMLDKVLEAGRFPFARIRVSGAGTGAGTIGVEITLHGTTRALQIPVQVDNRGDEIDVSGRLALNQTDFGITPFSILGGAVQVQDRMELRFRITAMRGFVNQRL